MTTRRRCVRPTAWRAAAFAALALAACGPEAPAPSTAAVDNGTPVTAPSRPEAPAALTFAGAPLPPTFPLPPDPADNRTTAAKAELGRLLFYDTRLSDDGTRACASCHEQRLAFSDGLTVAVGKDGARHRRNTPGLGNVAYAPTLTWAHPTLPRLEDQADAPLFGTAPVEMGAAGHEAEILARLVAEPVYVERFAAAFADAATAPIDFARVKAALAAFLRTLISGDSPVDRYLRGDRDALSPAARRGMRLFQSDHTRCAECHGGFLWTTAVTTAGGPAPRRIFANIGLYNLDDEGAYPAGDTGLLEYTGAATDMGRFRIPTIRNVAKTGPYMHDGSLRTLTDVVQFYANGGLWTTVGEITQEGEANPLRDREIHPFLISEGAREDMVRFMEALTDRGFLGDPRFSDPFTLPTAPPRYVP